MLKILLALLVTTFLWANCTSPSSANAALKGYENVLQAPSRSSVPAEDTDILLARKWQSEDGTLLLDLNLNGDFVGELDGRPIEGQWQISDDHKILTLNESKGLEGKGKVVNVSYDVVSINPEVLVLQDTKDKTWTLAALE